MTIETLQFHSREQWLGARERDVTASVVGCLLDGVAHPYVTPAQLHLLKTGEASDEVAETPAMKRGRMLESLVIDILAEGFPEWNATRNLVPGPGLYFRDIERRIGATPDAFGADKRGRGVIQIKSVWAPSFAAWKDATGRIAAPDWIVAQAVTEAKLTGASWAVVAVLVNGSALDLHIIDVPLDDGLWPRIQAAVAAFWGRIEAGEAPDFDLDLDAALVASLWRRDDGSVIDLSGDNAFIDALHQRESLKAEEAAVAKELNRLGTLLRLKMGPAQKAIAGDWRVDLKTTARRGYVVAPSTVRRLQAKRLKPKETKA